VVSRVIVEPGGRGRPRLSIEDRVVLRAIYNGDDVPWPFPA